LLGRLLAPFASNPHSEPARAAAREQAIKDTTLAILSALDNAAVDDIVAPDFTAAATNAMGPQESACARAAALPLLLPRSLRLPPPPQTIILVLRTLYS
jgi:hypothetical protein